MKTTDISIAVSGISHKCSLSGNKHFLISGCMQFRNNLANNCRVAIRREYREAMFLCVFLHLHDGGGLGGKCPRVCGCVTGYQDGDLCECACECVLFRHAANVEALSTASFTSGYTVWLQTCHSPTLGVVTVCPCVSCYVCMLPSVTLCGCFCLNKRTGQSKHCLWIHI